MGKNTDTENMMTARKRNHNRENRHRSRANTLRVRSQMTLQSKLSMASTLKGLAISRGLSLKECGDLDFCLNH